MSKNLILVGGGGHCKSVIDVAESAGYTVIGVLDMPENVGKDILSTKVIGTDNDIPTYVGMAKFLITVGFIKDSSIRVRLYNRVKEAGGEFATVVASSAHVSKYATIGDGTVVMHHAFVNAGARVGSNVILNSFIDIEHDSVIGSHCHISTGAIINGGCIVGDCCFVGSQSVLVNGVVINDNIIVGAGSVVNKSLYKPGIYYGSPAGFINR